MTTLQPEPETMPRIGAIMSTPMLFRGWQSLMFRLFGEHGSPAHCKLSRAFRTWLATKYMSHRCCSQMWLSQAAAPSALHELWARCPKSRPALLGSEFQSCNPPHLPVSDSLASLASEPGAACLGHFGALAAPCRHKVQQRYPLIQKHTMRLDCTSRPNQIRDSDALLTSHYGLFPDKEAERKSRQLSTRSF